MNERKIYYSFNDTPFSTGNNNYNQPSKSGFKFSQTEILHIIIAIAALTIAFAFALAPAYPPISHLDQVLSTLPLSFLAILTAFFCHELAHKYMGQKYGYWSEFRMYKMGLLLALFLGVFAGFVFAAPGAVRIYGSPNREESGRISVAGPLTNIILASAATVVTLFTSGTIFLIAAFIASINAFLAFFNLLPIGPLDGSKIFHWNKTLWFVLIILSITLFIGPVF